MDTDREEMTIRPAEKEDARQIAEILVEDWQKAYRGIIDGAYLDAMSVEERTEREAGRYGIYRVASRGKEILGFAWNDMTGGGDADCEIIALYVRHGLRGSGIGRALFRDAAARFRAAGKKTMAVWCLRDNLEARKFYERMGGKTDRPGTHPWGGRDYPMISYLWHLEE